MFCLLRLRLRPAIWNSRRDTLNIVCPEVPNLPFHLLTCGKHLRETSYGYKTGTWSGTNVTNLADSESSSSSSSSSTSSSGGSGTVSPFASASFLACSYLQHSGLQPLETYPASSYWEIPLQIIAPAQRPKVQMQTAESATPLSFIL